MDEAFIETLYADTTSLYRLDQGGSSATGKTDLGPLPKTAVVLLVSLAVVWILIILYVILQAKKQKSY